MLSINEETLRLKKEYPKLQFFIKELHWTNQSLNYSRIPSSWLSLRANRIMKKLINPFIKIIPTWNYVLSRRENMKVNNVHNFGVEDLNIAKLFLHYIE